MNVPRNHLPHDLKVFRYLSALKSGDLEAVAALWKEASLDPQLECFLTELDEELFTEETTRQRKSGAKRDTIGHRALTGQLAEDLGWLEEHSRQRGAAHADHALRAGELRLAAALVRNCIDPYLGGQSASPLHLAVIGGAGAGKSTVA